MVSRMSAIPVGIRALKEHRWTFPQSWKTLRPKSTRWWTARRRQPMRTATNSSGASIRHKTTPIGPSTTPSNKLWKPPIEANSKWAQMKADAAAKREDIKAKIDKRADQLDAKAAATDADWAEQDAADAIDYAEWMVYDAQLAVLDALDARAYADEQARIAGT